MVGDVEGPTRSLLDDHDRHPLIRRFPQRREEAVDDEWGQPERHLVCEHQLRVSAECSGQREHLLLAARDQARGSVEERFELGEEPDRALDRHATEAQVVGDGERTDGGAFFRDERGAVEPLCGGEPDR